MIKKTSLVLMAFLIIESVAIGQQQAPYYNDNTYDFARNRDVIFNPIMVNPTQLTDSNSIIIDMALYDQWLESSISNNGFFIKAETGLLPRNMSVGLVFDFKSNDLYDQRSVIGSFKKGIKLGTYSMLDLGFNLGFWQTKTNNPDLGSYPYDPMFNSTDEWTNPTILDIGSTYHYKNQRFGLSYKSDIESSYYRSKVYGFVLTYQGVYAVSNSISITPELINFITSDGLEIIGVAKINYKRVLTGGVLYNTNSTFGCLLSGTIKKKIKIGYYFDYSYISNDTSKRKGSNSLNLGYIFN